MDQRQITILPIHVVRGMEARQYGQDSIRACAFYQAAIDALGADRVIAVGAISITTQIGPPYFAPNDSPALRELEWHFDSGNYAAAAMLLPLTVTVSRL